MGRRQYTTKTTVIVGRKAGLALGNGGPYRRRNPLTPLPVSQEWVFSATDAAEIRSRIEEIADKYGADVLAQLAQNLTWLEANSKYEAVREISRRWLNEMEALGFRKEGDAQ